MKMRTLMLILGVGLVTCALSFAGDAKIEQALRDLDDQWSKAAGAKDVDKTVSFYSDDATVLPPNDATVTTKEGTRNLWKGFLDSIDSISWKVTRVEAAKSGDIAYSIGTYETTSKSGNDRGKYLEVWKKQADGSWKCAVDMFSSDLPVPSPNK